MVRMRPRTGRGLAACLIGAGCVAWGLAGGLPGTALAAASSQCEALPGGPSASPSASQAELCVSVQAAQSGIKRGQAASFTVQVSAQNGSASGVSVTLAASPQGQAATFTGRCPGGNGSATCTVGSLGTSLAPATYSLQAQIAVASSASSVTSVTLTATADAATSPGMAAMPSASQSVSVAAAAASASASAKATASASTSPVAQVSPVSTPGLATVLPPVTVPTPAGMTTSLFTPANVASDLPEIAPVPTPAPVTGTPGSPVADTGSPQAGSFTLALNMSAATAQVFGLIIVALALTLAATKLVADYLTPRRNGGAAASSKKPAHGKNGDGGTGWRSGFFRRSRTQASPAAEALPAAPAQQPVSGKPGQ